MVTWVAICLFTAAYFVSLSLGVIAQRFAGASAAGRSSSGQNAALAPASCVLNLAHEKPSWTPRPAGSVALTFDDGPDPTWTPKILAVLARHHVPGTFFVVGSRVLEHPGLVRRELQHGNEIGSHTFSHAHMDAVPAWQATLQLSLTEKAIAGATGQRTSLYRPPYSGRPVDLAGPAFEAARRVGRAGYLLVLADYIASDWLPGSPAELAKRALPPAGQSGVIMFHDGGGNRARTVEALDRVVTTLQQRRYHFVSVSAYAGLRRSTVLMSANISDRLQGKVILGSVRLARWSASALGILTTVLLAVAIMRGVIVIGFAGRHARRGRLQPESAYSPAVTVVMPAFNEAMCIEAAARSIAASDYPDFEVIVVDDGSTDRTPELVDALGLADTRVITQSNAGKAAALNTGIAAARHDVLVLVDADTVFEPTTLRALVKPLQDPAVGAVSGNTKVRNRGGLLGRWQHIEYVISCSVERRMFDVLDCMPCVPGAIGAFRRSAIDAAGGLSRDTLAEDTDITMAVLRAGWKVRYEPSARAWTEVPLTMRDLWRQRYRWSYGTLQAMWKHRNSVRETGPGGHLGRRGLPYLTFYTLVLPVLSPVVDVFVIYGLLSGDPLHSLEVWVGVNVITLIVGAIAFRLDGESLRPLWLLPLQQFVYRQAMYSIVLQSIKAALLGVRVRWQQLSRAGQTHSRSSAVTADPSVTTAHRTPVFVATIGKKARRRRRGGYGLAIIASLASLALFASLFTPLARSETGDLPIAEVITHPTRHSSSALNSSAPNASAAPTSPATPTPPAFPRASTAQRHGFGRATPHRTSNPTARRVHFHLHLQPRPRPQHANPRPVRRQQTNPVGRLHSSAV